MRAPANISCKSAGVSQCAWTWFGIDFFLTTFPPKNTVRVTFLIHFWNFYAFTQVRAKAFVFLVCLSMHHINLTPQDPSGNFLAETTWIKV